MASLILAPGEGFLFRHNRGTDILKTFVGEVAQGYLVNPVPGTNYVYTVETAEGAGATNWTPWPGTDWPKRTHQWSIPGPPDEKRIFRVRAERKVDSSEPVPAQTKEMPNPDSGLVKTEDRKPNASVNARAIHQKLRR